MMRIPSRSFFLLAALLAVPAALLADEAPNLAAQVADLTAQVKAAQMAGDNAWIMTSSALVLMMTAPGLVLFYGGLVRAKNVLSIFMQSFYLMAVVSIIWLVFGYSFAFSKGNAFFGGMDKLFLRGVGGEPSVYAGTIPEQSYMFFQLMFAIITPALMTGAFAERFRFKALVPFMILWVLIVYLPLAHMVWGQGGFLNAFLGPENGKGVPALDFAGGTVVHISSGISALICALYLGRRAGYPSQQFAPHSLVLSAVGAGMLWVGWFGFNAGSAVSAGALASSAFTATHMSAAGATMSWLLAEWIFRKKPSLLGGISGAVAGLVAVTPAAGFVTPLSGLIIGLIAGVVCMLAVTRLKSLFRYDDALDVFGVHGIGGITGAILTGVFATKAIQTPPGAAFQNGVGLVDGNPGQIVNQLIAVLLTVGLSAVATFVLLVLVDKTIGVKATIDEQEQGMDIVDHGENAYHAA
ncbi:ammonium transporter [soil metagenome]